MKALQKLNKVPPDFFVGTNFFVAKNAQFATNRLQAPHGLQQGPKDQDHTIYETVCGFVAQLIILLPC